MGRKLILSDMDGTLLSSRHAVSEKTIKTVDRFIQSGGIFTVATGRRFSATLSCLGGLRINAPLVCYQGSLIAETDGTVLSASKIGWQTAAEILSELETQNKYCQIYDEQCFFVERRTAITDRYEAISPGAIAETKMPLSRFVAETKTDLYKILIVENPKLTAQTIKQINTQFGKEVNAHLSQADFVEIADVRANKGTALEFLRRRFDVDIKDVIAVGDSMNDLPMIHAAGVGVAVANACDAVKKAADFITESNDMDGVAAAIEKFGF